MRLVDNYKAILLTGFASLAVFSGTTSASSALMQERAHITSKHAFRLPADHTTHTGGDKSGTVKNKDKNGDKSSAFATFPEGWKAVCQKTKDFPERIRTVLLGQKNINAAKQKQDSHGLYIFNCGSSGSFGDRLYGVFMNTMFNGRSITTVAEGVNEIQKISRNMQKDIRPLLDEAENVESILISAWEALKDRKHDIKELIAVLQATKFEGNGGDELSFALAQLLKSAESGDESAVAAWMGESCGAAMRLADLLRWAFLYAELGADIPQVFQRFGDYVEPSAAKYPWKPIMTGRLPGLQSIMMLCQREAPMLDYRLLHFLEVSETDKAAMGKLDVSKSYFAITPDQRDSYEKLLAATQKKAAKALEELPLCSYEISILNAQLERYQIDGVLDKLCETLKRFSSNHKNPTSQDIAECMHVLQGAYYASESAADRYCDAVVEAAEKVKGKPKEAPVEAHKAAYEIYGGGKNYQGGIQSLAEACRIHKMDCIRASNLLGAIYANAGYVGMHPVRMCRANPQDKTMGYNGHTITCVIDGKKSRTLDPLTPKAGPSFESVYKSTKEAASVSLGYRCLNSYMAGKFYFPNNGMKDVQLNMPHYGLKKMGL